MLIADLLKHKGASVVTIGPDDSISQLLRSLAEHKVGALVVLSPGEAAGTGRTPAHQAGADGTSGEQAGAVAGIVSERDVVRHLNTEGAALLQRRVGDVMSSPVISCTPEDSVEQVAELMTERRFRHMPVMRDGALVGIVTIGDVVAARIRQLEVDRRQLESYIVRGG
ncbi:CBS domain-containing protein [Jatrophihabitans telluris]|uniref:CBS domain-containing protein n=1 Tax=Jatrophihabitans telluris TaxID=2038343 RepID=A0ABY4QT41_9ACTN|nr:CBS domain-containing protein [Jatrophihabitans telluris]UQX86663.1 CBS domain-containing protein [Jatrophihabitans telluris]